MKSFWSRVIVFTERFGQMLSRIVLSILYVLCFAPVAFLVRASDPLDIRKWRSTSWNRWTSKNDDLDHARRQW